MGAFEEVTVQLLVGCGGNAIGSREDRWLEIHTHHQVAKDDTCYPESLLQRSLIKSGRAMMGWDLRARQREEVSIPDRGQQGCRPGTGRVWEGRFLQVCHSERPRGKAVRGAWAVRSVTHSGERWKRARPWEPGGQCRLVTVSAGQWGSWGRLLRSSKWCLTMKTLCLLFI